MNESKSVNVTIAQSTMEKVISKMMQKLHLVAKNILYL